MIMCFWYFTLLYVCIICHHNKHDYATFWVTRASKEISKRPLLRFLIYVTFLSFNQISPQWPSLFRTQCILYTTFFLFKHLIHAIQVIDCTEHRSLKSVMFPNSLSDEITFTFPTFTFLSQFSPAS